MLSPCFCPEDSSKLPNYLDLLSEIVHLPLEGKLQALNDSIRVVHVYVKGVKKIYNLQNKFISIASDWYKFCS